MMCEVLVTIVSFCGKIRTMFVVHCTHWHYCGKPRQLIRSSHKEISNLVFLENFSTLQGDHGGLGRQFRAPDWSYIS